MGRIECPNCTRKLHRNQFEHKIGSKSIFEHFKLLVGPSWTEFDPEDKICKRCCVQARSKSRVTNVGRKRKFTMPEGYPKIYKTNDVHTGSQSQPDKTFTNESHKKEKVYPCPLSIDPTFLLMLNEQSVQDILFTMTNTEKIHIAEILRDLPCSSAQIKAKDLILQAISHPNISNGTSTCSITEIPEVMSTHEDLGQQLFNSTVEETLMTDEIDTSQEDSNLFNINDNKSLNSQLSTSSIMTSSQHSQSSSKSVGSDKVILKGISTAMKTQSCCVICKSKEDRRRIPMKALHQAWLKKRILIPRSSRCCSKHMENGRFSETELDKLNSISSKTEMTINEVVEWIQKLTDYAQKPKCLLNFDEDSELTDEEFIIMTSLSKEEFEITFGYIKHTLHNSCNRSPRNALAMFLIKLRLNLSQNLIGFLFGVDQARVSDVFRAVAPALATHFVPVNLGYTHLNREEALAHVPACSRITLQLTPDQLGVAADCTYAFIQKPGDYEMQRKTFSVHKMRNLVKPMIVVLLDGYILDAGGPYFADGENNDASIFKLMLQSTAPDSINSFLRKGDALILDRGFRDVVEFCKERGFQVYMPSLLSKGDNQFTTEDANTSRIVTLQRWVVEAINGHLKSRFKFLDQVVHNRYLNVIGDWSRIAAALINRFSERIFDGSTFSEEKAHRIRAKLPTINVLKKKVEDQNLIKKRAIWLEASADTIPEFPLLTETDLDELTEGVFQINNGKQYTIQHFDVFGCYKIFVHTHEKNLLRVKMQSRYRKRHTHQLWIEIDAETAGVESIKGWYCTCRTGARSLGMCSHIASILWYMGYQRHTGQPTPRRSIYTIIDAAAGQVDSDDSDSDDSDSDDSDSDDSDSDDSDSDDSDSDAA